jgi:hypothetical protein
MSQTDVEEVVDWQSQLNDDEIGKEDGTEFVFLKGLRRLAKIKGIVAESHVLGNVVILKRPDNGNEYPFVQVQYTVVFQDGTTFSDVADAHTFNVQGVFSAYPTAMAATRAEARALRKALGISLVAKEELGAARDTIANMRNESTPAQMRVIKNLMKTRNIKNAMDVIKHASSRDDVFDIKDLTHAEAVAGIKWLNSQKVK